MLPCPQTGGTGGHWFPLLAMLQLLGGEIQYFSAGGYNVSFVFT